jgi:hypothetical protein
VSRTRQEPRSWEVAPHGASVDETGVSIWESGPFGGSGTGVTHAEFLRGRHWDFVESYLGRDALLAMLVEVVVRARRTHAIDAIDAIPARWISLPPLELERDRELLFADLAARCNPVDDKIYRREAVPPQPAPEFVSPQSRRARQTCAAPWQPTLTPDRCATCQALGPQVAADAMGAVLPVPADRLCAFARSDFPDSTESYLLGCPQCGTFYLYSYDAGDNCPTSGYGESLSRLDPKAALAYLAKPHVAERRWLERQEL